MGNLRDAAELLSSAVEATISALGLQPEDAAAVQLARYYARTIDQVPGLQHEALEKLGPKLLTALESLGATPAARARIRNTARGGDNAPVSWLDQQRAALTAGRAKRT